MKYFIGSENKVYAYELDGSQDAFINPEFSPISRANADLINNPPRTLQQLKATKTAEIKTACGLAIASGITSHVLGSAHSYPTTQLDQINFTGLITSSLLPDSGDEYKFWCADANGIWDRRIHTKLQIQIVGKAVANHVILQQDKYKQKLTEIDAATDSISLALVIW